MRNRFFKTLVLALTFAFALCLSASLTACGKDSGQNSANVNSGSEISSSLNEQSSSSEECKHQIVIDNAVNPTCESIGLTEGSHCSVCGEVLVEQEVVGALGHTPASAVIENNVEADCVNDGSYDSVVYCSVCDEELSRETIIVDALGHTEVVDQAVEASCTQTGLTQGSHCSVCGEVLVVQTVIPLTDHLAESEWRYNETYHWQNSTCGCNQLINYAEHTLEDSGWCSVCNQAIRPSNGIFYEASADGTYAEVVACASNLTKVNIAETYEGLPVTNIYANAFANSSITELVLPDTLLTIGDYAFYNCDGLTSIEIPNSVTSIGAFAFYGCSSLTEVNYLGTIDQWAEIEFDGDYANPLCYAKQLKVNGEVVTEVNLTSATKVSKFSFCNCDSLTSVVIGDSVTSIGGRAFSSCDGLTSVVIGDSVTSIGYEAFRGCDSLTSVEIPDSVTSIGDWAFSGCYKLVEVINKSSHITVSKGSSSNGDVGYYALSVSNCDNTYVSKLTNDNGYIIYTDGAEKILVGYNGTETALTLPSYVTKIYQYAFYYCDSLTSVVIPNSVNSIGDNAFYNCDGLTSVVIGDSVTSIGEAAFYNCDGLTSIEIPDSVTSIGDWAFHNCRGLTSVVIGDSVTSIGEAAFEDCSSLTSVVIGDSVTSIGNRAFRDCDNLTNIYITNLAGWCNVTGASNLMCYGSSSKNLYVNNEFVTELVIPDSVTSIGDYAFYSCDSLTSVEIGDSVTSIGNRAFRDCYKLVEVINKSSHITVSKGRSSNGYVGYYALSVSNCDNTYVSKLTKDNGYIIYTDGAEKVLVGYNGTETDLVLPSYITKIYQYAFYNYDSLTSVVIGDSVTSIGGCAFYNCSSLEFNVHGNGLYLGNENNPFIALIKGSNTEISTLEVHQDVKVIADYAFSGYARLTSVVIGDSVTSIGEDAFLYCSNLTSVVIGDSVTSIGDSAFEDCYKLVEVINKSSHITVSKGWSSNGYVGFYALSVSNCDNTYVSKLTNDNGYIIYTDGAEKILVGYTGTETALTLPSYVTKINQYAFYNCDSLTSVEIGDSVTSIADYAFYHCSSLEFNVYGNGLYLGNENNPFIALIKGSNTAISTLEIHQDAKIIADCAFSSYARLTSVVIGDSVTSIGERAFAYCRSLTSIEIPNSVTSIGDSAFVYCDSLTSVVIGDSVTSIGSSAFNGCPIESAKIPAIACSCIKNSNLKTVEITSGEIPNSAFWGCSSLTSVVIGDSVTSIGDGAFSSCDGLTSVVIGDSVTSIGYEAFRGCDSLTSVEIPDSVTSIGEDAFSWCSGLTSVVIGDSVTSIGDRTFYYCDSLTSVVIGDSVTSIGDRTFYSCDSLTSIEIPNSVTSIGESAFRYCDGLTSIEIPDSVTSIGLGAFGGCSSLQSITIPFVGDKAGKTSSDTYQYPFGYIFGTSSYTGATATTQYYYGLSTSSTTYSTYYIPTSLKQVTVTGGNILYGAFYGCYNLTSVVIGDSVTSIGSSAFYYCRSLTSVEIGASVTSIGDSAFRGCSSLTSVEIGDSVTSIGNSAFAYCDSLTSVVIGDSVTSISGAAFYKCSGLTSIEIPDSVTSIGGRAFYNCSSLTSVVIPDSVTSIDDYAFEDCYKLVEVINKSSHITVSKGSSSNGYVGYYALSVSNCDNTYVSKITNDNGYIIYTEGAEKVLVGYNGTETDLVLPSYITKIYQYAFEDCGSLTSVVIGDSVTSIGDYAFEECSSLTSIKYRGTQSQWNAISKGDGWNRYTGSYIITYNYTGE